MTESTQVTFNIDDSRDLLQKYQSEFADRRYQALEDTFSAQIYYASKEKMPAVVDFITAELAKLHPGNVYRPQVTYFYEDTASIVNPLVFIVVNVYHSTKFKVTFKGDRKTIEALQSTLKPDTAKAELHWYYSNGHGTDSREVDLVVKHEVKDCHYPFIKQGLDAFYEEYRKSEASVLILYGDPGTGKTSFVRNFIHKYGLSAVVTFDEKVMESDSFYLDYMTEDKDLLVIEDADLLLGKRESEGNKTMAKLLNMSEGLVQLFNKKIIFTTNLAELNKIDKALLRPGRCFDAVEFRSLTDTEANEVCDSYGMQQLPSKRDGHTLGEIFERHKKSASPQKFGLI